MEQELVFSKIPKKKKKKSFNIIAMLSVIPICMVYELHHKKKRQILESQNQKKPTFLLYIDAIIFVLVDTALQRYRTPKRNIEDKKTPGAAGNQRYARIGDVIIAVIKDAVPQMPLERSEVIRAVIVRTRKEFKGDDGIIIRYDDNAAVIIDQKGNPKGTRKLNLTKIVSLAPEILSHVYALKILNLKKRENMLIIEKLGGT
ncbi:hypothetical protein ACJX0J_003323 [Zea mays]